MVATGLNNLVENVAYSRVPCALVLEGNPAGADSRLDFESFPADGFEEAYAVSGYDEQAAERMPQPSYVVYRGGNWSSFTLELKFRAGDVLGRQTSLENVNTSDLNDILVAMERKARWCQALQFGLERDASQDIARILTTSATGGQSSDALNGKVKEALAAIGKVPRSDPPYVLVVIGSFLLLRTYVTGVTIKWEGPFHPITAQAYGCTVNIAFQRLDTTHPTWKSVRESAGRVPPTPHNPKIRGEINARMSVSRGRGSARAAANAQTVALGGGGFAALGGA
jgi:hypothetical protein